MEIVGTQRFNTDFLVNEIRVGYYIKPGLQKDFSEEAKKDIGPVDSFHVKEIFSFIDRTALDQSYTKFGKYDRFIQATLLDTWPSQSHDSRL